jgi:uncharacterized protein YcbX
MHYSRVAGGHMHLSSICVYPIKSGAGCALDHTRVEARGLAHDRRWMIVDESGRFLTGRQLPGLVRLHSALAAEGLHITAAQGNTIEVPFPESEAARVDVSVWKDNVRALDGGEAAAAWLSGVLHRAVRLVYMDESARRAINPAHARAGDEVSFADGYPLLLISQSALDGLNQRLEVPLPMLRFRPNLVIAGCEPHAEDHWRRIRIGSVEFELVKRCVRCVFTTVDPVRGEFDPSGEPLRTLKTYRRGEKGITFGTNLIARGRGHLRCGDPVSVLD